MAAPMEHPLAAHSAAQMAAQTAAQTVDCLASQLARLMASLSACSCLQVSWESLSEEPWWDRHWADLRAGQWAADLAER